MVYVYYKRSLSSIEMYRFYGEYGGSTCGVEGLDYGEMGKSAFFYIQNRTKMYRDRGMDRFLDRSVWGCTRRIRFRLVGLGIPGLGFVFHKATKTVSHIGYRNII